MGDTFEDVCSTIRACVVSSPSQQLSLKELNKEYRELEGESIPFRKFQYQNVEEFLDDVPDLKVNRGGSELYVRVRASEKIAHIDRLVKEQKKTKKKKSTSRTNFGFGRASLHSYQPRKKWYSPPLGNRVSALRNGNSSSAPDRFSGPDRLIRPSLASSNNIGRNLQASRTSNLLRPSAAVPGDYTKRVFRDYLSDCEPNIGRNSESSRTLYLSSSSAVPGEYEQRVGRDHGNGSRPSPERADDSVRDHMNGSRPSSARANDSVRDGARPFSDQADDSVRGHAVNGFRPFSDRADDSARGHVNGSQSFPERADDSVRGHANGSRPFLDRADKSVRGHANGSRQFFGRADDDGSVHGEPQHESQITKVGGAEERNKMPGLNRTLRYAAPREPARMSSRDEDHLDSSQPPRNSYSNHRNLTSDNGVSNSRDDVLLFRSIDDTRLQIDQILKSMKNIAITIRMGSSLRTVTTNMPERSKIRHTSPVRKPYSIRTVFEEKIPSATGENSSGTTPRKDDLSQRPATPTLRSYSPRTVQEEIPTVDLTGEGSQPIIIYPVSNYLSRGRAPLSPLPARPVLEQKMSNVSGEDAFGISLEQNDLRHRINNLRQKKVPTVTAEDSPGMLPERSDIHYGFATVRPYSPRSVPEERKPTVTGNGSFGIWPYKNTAQNRLAKLKSNLQKQIREGGMFAVSEEDSPGILLEKNDLCHRLNMLRQKKISTGVTGKESPGTGPGKSDHRHGLNMSRPDKMAAVNGQNSSGTGTLPKAGGAGKPLLSKTASQESTSSATAREEVIKLEYSLARSKSVPSLQLTVKQRLRISFTEITDPNYFIMQPSAYRKELESLSASMKIIYDTQKPPVSIGTITKGNLFAVRNEEFKVWSRGEVIELIPDLDQVSVLCIDYGNIISVHYQNIYQLMQCFHELPALAIKASLANVIPSAGKWTTGDRVRFRTLLTEVGDIVSAVVDVRDDTVEVLLYVFTNGSWIEVAAILEAENRSTCKYALNL